MLKRMSFILGMLVFTSLLSPLAYADSNATLQDSEVKIAPKQCLNELAKTETAEQQAADKDNKKDEPNWFQKVIKKHKLGSLHFQDIIELFH